MNTIKQQIEQEAQSLALSLYNVGMEIDHATLERDRIKKRLQELSVSMNTIGAIEKAKAEDAPKGTITEE